jgi:hypothetical protein
MGGIFGSNADLRINRKNVNEKNPIPVEERDRNFDAFSRFRVSEPLTLFEVQHQYNTQHLLWKDTLTNGGTITHLPNESANLLTVTTEIGSRVLRQTKENFRYQPGKSQYVAITGVFGLPKTGVVQRTGYYNDGNGMFFEQDQNGLKVVLRSLTTGSPVDIGILQSDWNLDKMDGTGFSGITLNMALAQIFVIDFQWLGVGRIRFGLNVGGKLYYVHEILNSNVVPTVYCTTANLPLRYEILNTAETASNTSMTQICSTVISEGGFNRDGLPFTANNGVTGISVTTRRPILSIQPRSTFNSIANTATVVPSDFSILTQTNSVLFELVYGGTLTGANWQNVNLNNSLIQYDVSATEISGGFVVSSGYVLTSGSGSKSGNTALKGLLSRLPLTKDDSLTIVCTSLNSTATCMGSIDWHELY